MKGLHLLSVLVGVFLLFGFGCTQKTIIVSPGDLQGSRTPSGSVLERGVNRFPDLVDVRLEGATDGVVTEIFGKVVNSAPLVVSARRYTSRTIPDNPQASWVVWRATVADGADAFNLQTEMMEMFREIISAGGFVTIYNVPYRYNASEIGLLKGLRPMDATSKSILFIVDRELARDLEMAGK